VWSKRVHSEWKDVGARLMVIIVCWFCFCNSIEFRKLFSASTTLASRPRGNLRRPSCRSSHVTSYLGKSKSPSGEKPPLIRGQRSRHCDASPGACFVVDGMALRHASLGTGKHWENIATAALYPASRGAASSQPALATRCITYRARLKSILAKSFWRFRSLLSNY